jgi:glutathione S-transferase
MSNVTLYGPPQSSYVRTARFVCNEKGIEHTLESVKLGSEQHLDLHPYAKVPVLRHGDLQLWETSAIARYVDAAFDGPALQPTGAAALARMEQWISAINCYMYEHTVRNYALQYIFPKGADGAPDRAVIDAHVPKVQLAVRQLDAAYGESEWIAGDSISLADMFVAPLVATFSMFPEGAAALEDARNLKRAYNAIATRDTYKAVQPPAS